MTRNKSPIPPVRPNSWLVSFNDLLTLLLTFFILIVSLSSLHTAYLRSAAESVAKALNQSGTEGASREFIRGSLERIPGLTVREEKNSLHVSLHESILFEKGSADLQAGAQEVLKEVAEVVKTAGVPVQVEGHTDNLPIRTERFPSNWELSVARAVSVVKSLSEHGVPNERLSAAGYADSRPVASNATEQGRAMNRRTEIILVWQEESWQGKKR